MAKVKKTKTPPTATDKQMHSGYNEKNPGDPQGAFKADSLETEPEDTEKREKGPGLKKQYSKP